MDERETTGSVELTRNEIYELAKAVSVRLAEMEEHEDTSAGWEAELLTKLLDAHRLLAVETWATLSHEEHEEADFSESHYRKAGSPTDSL